MSVDNVVVEDVVEGREDATNNPPPLVPPQAPQFPNNNNGNNNNAGTPIIQPVQPQPNRNNRGQNGGNGGNWAQNMGGNVGNHNSVTTDLVGIRTTTVVTGENQGNRGGNWNYNNNWNNQNFPNGGNNDYNDGFGNQGFGNQYRRNPNGGLNNANGGYYKEGNQFPHLYFPQPNRQSVASHFQLGEYDDASRRRCIRRQFHLSK
ncbi:unnamed protein product [Lactuca saligna]|uniref:Uncharacterized protein n=1 Tax=Lactuca saligna TaxID=75948 RepID=A0AA35XZT9_LACSI|nr:unnamed protein product [Lactuca saligna]